MSGESVHLLPCCAHRSESLRGLRPVKELIHRLRSRHRDGSLMVTLEAPSHNLEETLRRACEDPAHSLALVCGFSTDEIRQCIKSIPGCLDPCIISQSVGGKETLHFPSASLFERRTVTRVRSLGEGVRKELLRIAAMRLGTLRQISKPRDLERYFALRYEVWNHAGYLPVNSPLHAGAWEVDRCDRFAAPIGLFLPDGRLIACARLVEEFGRENKALIQAIDRLIQQRDDPVLARAFAYQGTIEQPFDILWGFHGFRAYYRRLLLAHESMAEVSRVAVHPDYRGRGLIEVLVDSLVSLARAEKVARLLLACPEAIAGLYRRCGFEPVPKLVAGHFFDIDRRSIVMQRRVHRVNPMRHHQQEYGK